MYSTRTLTHKSVLRLENLIAAQQSLNKRLKPKFISSELSEDDLIITLSQISQSMKEIVDLFAGIRHSVAATVVLRLGQDLIQLQADQKALTSMAEQKILRCRPLITSKLIFSQCSTTLKSSPKTQVSSASKNSEWIARMEAKLADDKIALKVKQEQAILERDIQQAKLQKFALKIQALEERARLKTLEVNSAKVSSQEQKLNEVYVPPLDNESSVTDHDRKLGFRSCLLLTSANYLPLVQPVSPTFQPLHSTVLSTTTGCAAPEESIAVGVAQVISSVALSTQNVSVSEVSISSTKGPNSSTVAELSINCEPFIDGCPSITKSPVSDCSGISPSPVTSYSSLLVTPNDTPYNSSFTFAAPTFYAASFFDKDPTPRDTSSLSDTASFVAELDAGDTPNFTPEPLDTMKLEVFLPPQVDIEVGLHHGYDVSSAPNQLEVVSFKPIEPFTDSTVIGSSKVETHHHVTELDTPFTEHRVASETEVECLLTDRQSAYLISSKMDALEVLEAGFKDHHESAGSYSFESVKFPELMSPAIYQDEEGHVKMPLPLKVLPFGGDFSFIAERRSDLLQNHFFEDKAFDEQHFFMQQTIEDSDHEIVDEFRSSDNFCFLPYLAVSRPKKPDKIGVVFDECAKAGASSLNDNVLQGPDLINRLLENLIQFNLMKVAFMCDIEKLFHKLRVPVPHYDLLRVFWLENPVLISVEKFSSMTTLCRAIANLSRFIKCKIKETENFIVCLQHKAQHLLF